MVMIRKGATPYKVAKKILKQEGVKVPKAQIIKKTKVSGPYLQH